MKLEREKLRDHRKLDNRKFAKERDRDKKIIEVFLEKVEKTKKFETETVSKKEIVIKTPIGKVRKSVWRMPRHREAKKDAANSEMRRLAVSMQRSVDVRMGEPIRDRTRISCSE